MNVFLWVVEMVNTPGRMQWSQKFVDVSQPTKTAQAFEFICCCYYMSTQTKKEKEQKAKKNSKNNRILNFLLIKLSLTVWKIINLIPIVRLSSRIKAEISRFLCFYIVLMYYPYILCVSKICRKPTVNVKNNQNLWFL